MKKALSLFLSVLMLIACASSTALAAGTVADSKEGRLDLDATVLIYGNANNDAYVDDDDVAALEAIIGGKEKWNKDEAPLADTDCDGKITQSDVDLLKKIINKETCEICIKNYYGETQKMHFPLTDRKICVTYAQCRDAIAILDRWDDVVVVNESVPDRSPANIDFSKYGHIGTTGSSAVGDTDVEVMLKYGVDFIVAIPRTDGTKEILDKYAAANDADVFYCMYGESAVSTILTLGVLMDAEENALNYVKYRETIKERITEGMKNVEPVKIAEIRFNLNEAKEAWYLGVDDRAPDHEVLDLLGDLYDGDDGNTFGEATRSKEFFIAQDADYIVQLEIGTKFTAPDEINERFETNVNILKGTRAYDEGHVIGVSYDQMSSFGNFANGLVVAHLLYPEEFSLEEAESTLQEWFDVFTPFEVDVAGGDYWYMYTGTGYPAK